MQYFALLIQTVFESIEPHSGRENNEFLTALTFPDCQFNK